MIVQWLFVMSFMSWSSSSSLALILSLIFLSITGCYSLITSIQFEKDVWFSLKPASARISSFSTSV